MHLSSGRSVRHEEVSKRNNWRREPNEQLNEDNEVATKRKTIKNMWSFLPDEIILEVCKYLPLNDLHSVAKSAIPRLARVAKDRSLRRNVHVDLWKGDEVFSHAVKLPNRYNIISLTLKCQQDPSSSKTELTPRMVGRLLEKMSCLKLLRIQGAKFKQWSRLSSVMSLFSFVCSHSFDFDCYLPQSVETLEFIDCSSSSGVPIGFTRRRIQEAKFKESSVMCYLPQSVDTLEREFIGCSSSIGFPIAIGFTRRKKGAQSAAYAHSASMIVTHFVGIFLQKVT